MAELEFLLQTSEDDCEAESNDAQSVGSSVLPLLFTLLLYSLLDFFAVVSSS